MDIRRRFGRGVSPDQSAVPSQNTELPEGTDASPVADVRYPEAVAPALAANGPAQPLAAPSTRAPEKALGVNDVLDPYGNFLSEGR